MMNPALDRWTPKDDKSLTEILGFEDENCKPVGAAQGGCPTEVNLRILGIEPEFPDDLSTIAGDTLNGSLAPPPPPNGYDGRYYHPGTPVKHGQYHDEDGNTMPETPSKYGQPSLASRSYTKGTNGPCSRRFQQIVVVALLFGVALLAAIAAMSVSLYRLRNPSSVDQELENSLGTLQEFAAENEIDFDFSDFQTAATATMIPTTSSQSGSGVSPTEAPVITNPDKPSGQQTVAPVETLSPREWILSQFSKADQQQFFEVGTLQDPATPQYRVVEWLSLDPSLQTYDLDRLVQRYALGVVYTSLTATSAADTMGLESWMTYTDECQWPLSRSSQTLCDDETGLVNELYLEDMNFNGTLASEIGLLTGLEHIYLTSNNLRGSIPTELGLLTQLERLNIPRNALDGSIPAEIGQLSALGLLSFGNNALVGSIPTELGKLERLSSLLLQNNNLEGPIPFELTFLPRLGFLSLHRNSLTGPIPEGLENLSALTSVSLEENEVTGVLPAAICELPDFLGATVDCDQIQCSCCDGCDPENFVPFPLDGDDTTAEDPTSVPAPTTLVAGDIPASEPTQAPSGAPSTCAFIGAQRGCYEVGEAIDFSLSNCDPGEDDLLALVERGDFDENGLSNPYIWTLACDAEACDYVVDQAQLFLQDGNVEDLPLRSWPYETGQYRLLYLRLIRPGAARPLAESQDFAIAEDCSGF